MIFFFFVWEVPAVGWMVGGVADTRKERRKEWAWWSFWLFHLLWHNEELLNAIWVSALYGTTFMKYIFPSSSFTLSVSSSQYPSPLTSNWRCHKGVQGQWFFKVKLTLMRSSRHMWTDAVAPAAPFSASLTKPKPYTQVSSPHTA